jgi:hypothetical protein
MQQWPQSLSPPSSSAHPTGFFLQKPKFPRHSHAETEPGERPLYSPSYPHPGSTPRTLLAAMSKVTVRRSSCERYGVRRVNERGNRYPRYDAQGSRTKNRLDGHESQHLLLPSRVHLVRDGYNLGQPRVEVQPFHVFVQPVKISDLLQTRFLYRNGYRVPLFAPRVSIAPRAGRRRRSTQVFDGLINVANSLCDALRPLSRPLGSSNRLRLLKEKRGTEEIVQAGFPECDSQPKRSRRGAKTNERLKQPSSAGQIHQLPLQAEVS